jgi:hypothetical protein
MVYCYPDIKRWSCQKRNIPITLAYVHALEERPDGQGVVAVRAHPHRRGVLGIGRSGWQVERSGELASSFMVDGQVDRTMPRAATTAAVPKSSFPLSSLRGGERSRQRIDESRRTGRVQGEGDLFRNWGCGRGGRFDLLRFFRYKKRAKRTIWFSVGMNDFFDVRRRRTKPGRATEMGRFFDVQK